LSIRYRCEIYLNAVFLRCFRDCFKNRVTRISENYHWVPRIREIRSL